MLLKSCHIYFILF